MRAYSYVSMHSNILLMVLTAIASDIFSFSAVICVHIPLYTQPNSPNSYIRKCYLLIHNKIKNLVNIKHLHINLFLALKVYYSSPGWYFAYYVQLVF